MTEFVDNQTVVNRFLEVLKRVTYPDFYFLVDSKKGAVYLQVACIGTCNVTGEAKVWKSRKWLLSKYMTDGEIVQTAFKAVLTAVEHETREKFKYRDQAIFDPHYDLEKLVELRRSEESIKERE